MGVKGFMGTFLSEPKCRVNPRCKVDSSDFPEKKSIFKLSMRIMSPYIII